MGMAIFSAFFMPCFKIGEYRTFWAVNGHVHYVMEKLIDYSGLFFILLVNHGWTSAFHYSCIGTKHKHESEQK